MYSVKSQVFNYFTKAQKSDFCHYIMSFVKKQFSEDTKTLLNKFLEDESYYLEINSSRFPWLSEYIDDEKFLKDLELYIQDNKKKYTYKEKQKPLVEKQKQYRKEQRVKAQEFKMSNEPPSRAQLSYYKNLCKKYKIEAVKDPEKLSKLDLRNMIDQILNQNEANDKNSVMSQLEEITKNKTG